MNYRIVNGAISYGAETILEEINFEIKEKEKIKDEKIKVTFFDGNYEEYERKKNEETLKYETSSKLENLQGQTNQKNKSNSILDTETSNIQKGKDKKQEEGQIDKINKNTNKNQYLINKEKNKLKNKISKIEKEIEEQEAKIKTIQQKMLEKENSSNYIKLSEFEEEIKNIENEISIKMEEWEELSNKYNEL